MQIHELNNYNGELDSGAYVAVDNGSDTGKVSVTGLLADTNADISELNTFLNARIDNIIAGGTAPSASEIVDARYGADGVTYASLGDAIRDQVTDLKSDFNSLLDNTDIVINPTLESGGINSSGSEFGETSGTYMRFTNYEETTSATSLEFLHTNTSNEAMYVAYYDNNYAFVKRVDASIGLAIDTAYPYFRLSFYMRNGNDEATYRTWFTWILENKIKTNLDRLNDVVSLQDQVDYTLENGGINGSGVDISGSTYMRFADYIPTEQASNIVFKDKKDGTTGATIFAVYYNSEKAFQTRVTTTKGYEIDTSYAYVRLSFHEATGANETLFRSWIYWSNNNPIVDEFKKIEAKVANNTFEKSGNVITVKSNKAVYSLQRITNQSINVDTWRLYSGDLIEPNGDLFNMWTNSDAEGVMKLVGEDDYIGGFHGDEIMTDVHVLVDGREIDMSQDYDETVFKTMIVYVESDIYHCNTSSDAGTKAFKRNKQLLFEGDKVIVSNDFKAVSDVSVQQAALAFFQCYRDDSSNNEILNSYSVNRDFKLYDILDTSVYPANSKYLTEAIYNTAYGNIVVKDTKIDPRYEQYYFSDVSIGTLISQDRLKIYFNTIPNTPSGVNMETGDDIFGTFEWEII